MITTIACGIAAAASLLPVGMSTPVYVTTPRGKNGNIFDPLGLATRAEVSAVLKRFAELTISSDTAQGWTMNGSGQWMSFRPRHTQA